MPTITLDRCETRSISIAAPPEDVLAVVGDARRLPEWAPNFARAVRPDGDAWIIDTGAGDLRVDLRVVPELGTADILRGDPPRGAFSRVLPNGDGSEYLFTQLFADGMSAADVERQLAVVEGELETVRELCEAG
jgi:hypothetical protein